MNERLRGQRRLLTFCLSLAFVAQVIAQQPSQPGGGIELRPESAVVSIFSCDARGRAVSEATGFFISADGKLASTRHAIKENPAREIVQLNDGRILDVAGIIADDPLHDLVLLQVKGDGFATLPLGSFDKVRRDASVEMIVNPYILKEGIRGVTDPTRFGGRSVGGKILTVNNLAGDYQWLSVRVPIRRGESGSPFLNTAGEVIGMARAQMGGSDETCFVVSVDYIRNLLTSPAPAILAPVASLQKRDSDEIYDDPDFRAGVNASEKGAHKEAMRRLELAVKRFPASGAFRVLLGGCYSRLSMYGDAAREFEKAAEINPANAMAWASLGLAYANENKFPEAAAAIRKAAALKPDLPEAWFNIAATYLFLKQYGEARATIQRLRDFKAPEADEMAENLTRALEIANTQPPLAK